MPLVTGELALVDRLRSRLPSPPNPDEVWIGDDAAVVRLPAGPTMLLAADSVVAGVHADLSFTPLESFGWKAVAASVSDIAAMGGETAYSLVTVSAPPGTDVELLYEGVADAAAAFAAPVVGGDLTSAGSLVVTVAVVGTCAGPPVLRSGASPGDGIWVTGPLGGSAAGLRLLLQGSATGGGAGGTRSGGAAGGGTATPAREAGELVEAHLRPVALIREGRAARLAGAGAMIDVSDGLAADLAHIARASGVGVRLDNVPVRAGATVEEALHGGEDFALVFCAPDRTRVERSFADLPAPVEIGVCTDDPGEKTLCGRALREDGWEHHW